MKREVFDRYGLFREEIKIVMDYDYFLRISGKERLFFVDEDFTVFTYHKGSNSGNPAKWFGVEADIFRVWRDNKNIPFIGKISKD